MTARRPPPENQRSILLSHEENETLFGLLGPKCQSLATAVVQLLLSEPPAHKRWTKYCCGVACFVKDNGKRAYFIQVFDIDQRQQLWEQELYTELEYCTPRTYFHTFEAEKCRAGLNFADEQEANRFERAIQERLRSRLERERRRSNSMLIQNNNKNRNNYNNNINKPSNMGIVPGLQVSNASSKPATIQKDKKREKKKGKLSKSDIGEPMRETFKHVQHVGWNPNTGFDLSKMDSGNLDPHLEKLFLIAGVTNQQLQDSATREYIYNVIDKNGFNELISQMKKEDLTTPETARPPVPARRLPATPQMPRPAPPVPPARVPPTAPPPAAGVHQPQMKVIPPPLPSRVPSPAIPQMAKAPSSRGQTPPAPPSAPPPPLAGGGGPPPPPPPPLPPPAPMFPEEDVASPSPARATPAAPVPDNRSALLNDIQKGLQLKPVLQRETSVPDSRGNLLKSIRDGIELRPVASTEPRPTSNESILDGMASILARALAERAQAIQASDDSDDEDEDDDDDDDWE